VVAQLEPVPLLVGREIGEIELHDAVEARRLALERGIPRDAGQAGRDVPDAGEVWEDVLALDLEGPEDVLPVGRERPQVPGGQEARRVAPEIPRAAELLAERGAHGDAAGERLGVLHVLAERAGRRPDLDLGLRLARRDGVAAPDLLELEIERRALHDV